MYRQVLLKDNLGNIIPLQDLGYGISQIIPILLACFTRQNTLIAIEQPEAQIHPRLQANLADIFALSAHFNKNKFILETHSEHLFLRFQRRCRELNEYEMELKGQYDYDDIMAFGEENDETKRVKSQKTIPLKEEISLRKERLESLNRGSIGEKHFFNDLYSFITHDKIKFTGHH